MANTIRAKRIPSPAVLGANVPFTSEVLLPGEVEGMSIRYCRAKSGRPIFLEEQHGTVHVRVFLGGSGKLTIGSRAYALNEIAVAATERNLSANLESVSSFIGFLDIAIDVSPADEDERSKHREQLPYVRRYSDCETYKEEIKSAKTISRTLLPADILPRFSMGSVQTTGPDVVGAHRHGMLEQFFFGLAGNSCHVRADDQELDFGEDMLLHIPLGSLHEVHVEPGHELHYLWLDFFRRQEDMSYIEQTHHPVR
jgi:mannose-6-phosphate isomerase-like protein (cupin superfamily)